MTQNIIILYAMPYQFTDDSGRVVSGLGIDYLLKDSLSPVQEGDAYGLKPVHANLSRDLLASLVSVPAVYEASFELGLQRNNRGVMTPALTLRKIQYLSEIA